LIKWKHLDQLEKGDQIAETIFGSTSQEILVQYGDMVDESNLSVLRMRGIKWISIIDNLDIVKGFEPIIEKEKIKEFETQLSGICDKIIKEGRIDTEKAESIGKDISLSIRTNYGDSIIPSLSRLIKFDDYTFTHQVNVAIISTTIAMDFFMNNPDELDKISIGGLLHDMGKLWIPPEILNSRESLSNVEFNIIKKHPEYGYGIAVFSGIEEKTILDCIKTHHERFDGKGYFNGLKNEEIPFVGRLLMVADVYDALTTVRPYKTAWSPYEAASFIVKESGKMFDPLVVKQFIDVFGIYPPNTRVLLSNGEKGIVIGSNRKTKTRPIVRIYGEKEDLVIDLSKEKKLSILKVLERKIENEQR